MGRIHEEPDLSPARRQIPGFSGQLPEGPANRRDDIIHMYKQFSEPVNMARLAEEIAPIVRARVRRVAASAGPELREDLAQEVFAALFAHGGRALHAWDPARGSLPSYVGLVAERVVVSFLRSGRRSGWREEPTDGNSLLEASGGRDTMAARLDARNLVTRLADRLPGVLSPLGLELFRRMFIEEASIDEIKGATQMTAGALYAWRCRLIRIVGGLAAELTV